MDELTEEQLHEIFDRDIRVELDALVSSSHRPAAPLLVLVGGQPGAGKSRSVSRIGAQHPGIVEIIGDNLRTYHPDYDRLMQEVPLAMPAATAQASGYWVGMSIEYLREQRRSTLIETTLRQADVVQQTATKFRQAGYGTELHVVAVPPEVSRLGTISRYAKQVEESGAGRWTPTVAHDVAARAIPTAVATLGESRAIDYLWIENRQGESYFQANVSLGERVEIAHEAIQALDAARQVANLPADEGRAWLDTAITAVRLCIRTKQSNPDLLATIGQIVNHDAYLVAQAAYPGNERAQQAALNALRVSLGPSSRASSRTS